MRCGSTVVFCTTETFVLYRFIERKHCTTGRRQDTTHFAWRLRFAFFNNKHKTICNMTGYQQKTIYSEIPADHDNDDSAAGAGGPVRRGSSSSAGQLVGVAVVVVLLLGLVGLLFNPSSNLQGQKASPLLAALDHGVAFEEGTTTSAKTRSCTFDECVAANCDHDLAPFTCLLHNGGPHGGCSAGPWTDDSCSDSCNLSKCNTLDYPEDLKSCVGVLCGEEWCKIGQLCGAGAQYQCQAGAGRFGCSADPYHWVLYGCPCCDATTC
jgi:hypothetical protein